MSVKPIEAIALASLSMAAAPLWSSAQDWYMLQGVAMGAALGAIMANTTILMRLWRIAASFLFGYMCAGIFINWLGQDSREGIRFISSLTAFAGFAAAKALELAMPDTFKRAAKVGKDALLDRVAALGVGNRTTDRASDVYARGTLDAGQDQAADGGGNSSDAR